MTSPWTQTRRHIRGSIFWPENMSRLLRQILRRLRSLNFIQRKAIVGDLYGNGFPRPKSLSTRGIESVLCSSCRRNGRGRVQAVQAAALSRTRTDRDRLETTKELVVGCGAKQFLFLGARFYAELFVLPLPVRLDMAEEGNCGSPLKTGE